MDGNELKPGKYLAKAILTYSSSKETKTLTKEVEVVVGTLLVNIADHSKEVLSESVSEITVDVESVWNDPIENVFAELIITKDGSNIATVKTPSEKINGFEKKTLKGYWNTKGLATGEYDMKIIVHYGGKTTEKDVKINIVEEVTGEAVVEEEKESSEEGMSMLTIIIIVVVIIVILNIILFVFLKKRRE